MKINKRLNKYVNEIIAIAGANDTTWDVGCNMFLANVKNYDKPDAPYYKGADLDWPEVAAELCPFTDEDERDMLQTFRDDYNKHMQEVIALRKEGKYDEAVKVMVEA